MNTLRSFARHLIYKKQCFLIQVERCWLAAPIVPTTSFCFGIEGERSTDFERCRSQGACRRLQRTWAGNFVKLMCTIRNKLRPGIYLLNPRAYRTFVLRQYHHRSPTEPLYPYYVFLEEETHPRSEPTARNCKRQETWAHVQTDTSSSSRF